MKKEYSILNYFNMRSLFMGVGLSKILNSSQEYFLISLVLGTILGVIFLHFVKLENKKNFINIIVSMVFMIFGLVILINMISSMYLPDMPKNLVSIPLLLLLAYILSKKEIVLFRVASILIFLNIFIYLLATLSLVPYFDFSNFNYTDTPVVNIFISALEYMILSVAPTILMRDKKYSNYSLVKTYVISSITLSAWFILTYGILGSNLVGMYRYPEYIILKKVSIANSLENIENIVSFMWIFDIIMLLLSAGNNIKNNLNHQWLLYIILPIIFVAVGFINMDYTYLIVIYKYGTWIIAGISLIYILLNKKVHRS